MTLAPPQLDPQHSLIGMRPEAIPAWLNLVDHLDELRTVGTAPPCTRYPHDFTGDEAETRAVAAKLCASCPAFSACTEFAALNREAAHVWGGADRSTTRLCARCGERFDKKRNASLCRGCRSEDEQS